MGNCVFKDIKNENPDALDNLLFKNSFEKQHVVGRGGFGKVWKIQSKNSKTINYALKEMSKARVLAKKCLNSVIMERNILSQLNHP